MTAIIPRVIIMLHLVTPTFGPLMISPSAKWLTSKEHSVSSKCDRRAARFASRDTIVRPVTPIGGAGHQSGLQLGDCRASDFPQRRTEAMTVEIDRVDRSRVNCRLHRQLPRHGLPNATRAIPTVVLNEISLSLLSLLFINRAPKAWAFRQIHVRQGRCLLPAIYAIGLAFKESATR